MGLFNTVAGVLKRAGTWAFQNPERAMAIMQHMEGMQTGSKYASNHHSDRILVAEQRLNQLQEKLEKQDKKLDALYRQTQAMDKQIRKLRIWLTVTGIALALALVVIALFAFVI